MSGGEKYRIGKARRFRGRWNASGDKSQTHRAYLFNALAEGESQVSNANTGEDCERTRRALLELGVSFEAKGKAAWGINGRAGRFRAPDETLDAGNSCTTARLLAGLLAGQKFAAGIDGDNSLRSRPMARVAEPLRAFGAVIELAEDERAPIRVEGGALKACRYESELASAQVKGAFLLAALQAEGESLYREARASRDHSEVMLEAMGAEITRDEEGWIHLEGPQRLQAQDFEIPGDLSSAAFLLGAGILVEGGSVVVKRVGVNPTRAGILAVLERMGAKMAVYHPRVNGGEPLADLLAQHGPLRGTEIHEAEVPFLIDEIPLLAALASQAKGASVFHGLGELRHKESDRLAATVGMLQAFGAEARLEGESLVIAGGASLRGCEFDAAGDHRMAMSAGVLALVARGQTLIEGVEGVETSFPEFPSLLRRYSSKALELEKGAGR